MHLQEIEQPERIGRFWLFPSGEVLPVVSGGDGDEGSDDAGADDGGDDGGEDDGKPTLTQKQANAIMAREKREGRRSGRSDLLKELGIESEDELKNLVKRQAEAEAKNRTDLENAKLESDTHRSRADKAEAELAKAALTGRVIDALQDAGLTRKAAKRARSLVEINDPEADDSDIEDAVAALKEDVPSLFVQDGEDDDPDRPSPSSPKADPGKPPKSRPGGKASADERARERLNTMYSGRIAARQRENAK